MGLILVDSVSGKSAAWNMEEDYKALETISANGSPILHFYNWEMPSATYGYFLNPWDFFYKEGVEKFNLSLAKRPTGGGALFHTNDLSFSIVVPSTHPFYHVNPIFSYHFINQEVVSALKKVGFSYDFQLLHPKKSTRTHFCMLEPTTYDILVDGKKCGGSAQRKTRSALLHQGSLCLDLPSRDLLEGCLKNGKEHMDVLKKTSFCLSQPNILEPQLKDILKKQLFMQFSNFEEKIDPIMYPFLKKI